MPKLIPSDRLEQALILMSSGFSCHTTPIHITEIADTYYVQTKDETSLKNIIASPRISLFFPESKTKILAIAQSTQCPPLLNAEDGQVYQLYLYKKEENGQKFDIKDKQWLEGNDSNITSSELSLKEQCSLYKQVLTSRSSLLAVYPILAGALLAFETWKGVSFHHLLLLIATLIGGISALIGLKCISLYYDYIRGDDITNAFPSEEKTLLGEHITTENALVCSLLFFSIASFAAGFLISEMGFIMLILCALGLFFGYAYTGGKFRLKYRGYGEILSFCLAPLLLLGTYYLLLHTLSMQAFVISIALGFLLASSSLYKHFKNIDFDKKKAYETLPIKLGVKKAKCLYLLATYMPYLLIACLAIMHFKFIPLLLVFLSIPEANKAVKNIFSKEQIEKEEQIKPLSQYLFFALLLTLGLLVSLFIFF